MTVHGPFRKGNGTNDELTQLYLITTKSAYVVQKIFSGIVVVVLCFLMLLLLISGYLEFVHGESIMTTLYDSLFSMFILFILFFLSYTNTIYLCDKYIVIKNGFPFKYPVIIPLESIYRIKVNKYSGIMILYCNVPFLKNVRVATDRRGTKFEEVVALVVENCSKLGVFCQIQND